MSEQLLSLPVLPIKNTVLFPNLLMPLSVGRPQSIAAIQAALATEAKEILVVTQRDSSVEVPSPEDLFPTATKAVIKRSGRAGENKYELLVVGVERASQVDFEQGSYITATTGPTRCPPKAPPSWKHCTSNWYFGPRSEKCQRRTAGRVRPDDYGSRRPAPDGVPDRERAQHGR